MRFRELCSNCVYRIERPNAKHKSTQLYCLVHGGNIQMKCLVKKEGEPIIERIEKLERLTDD